MILLKVRSSKPDAFLTGKHLQSVSIDSPGTLQSTMGNTLKHKEEALSFFRIWSLSLKFICVEQNSGSSATTHTICILHPGVFTILLFNSNPNDSPYHGLAGGNTTCFVTLLCILHEKTNGGMCEKENGEEPLILRTQNPSRDKNTKIKNEPLHPDKRDKPQFFERISADDFLLKMLIHLIKVISAHTSFLAQNRTHSNSHLTQRNLLRSR